MTNKKVVLFGASKGGESFITHNQHLKVLAIVDNDTQRWGSQLLGIPIISPKELASINYEQVIITSQWLDSIKSQLINELKVAPNKIHIPNKNNLKSSEEPFRCATTLSIAREALGKITQFLEKNNIKAITDSGTALGLVRDSDLIAWDDDIDLAIVGESFNKMLEIAKPLLAELPQHPVIKWQATIVFLAEEAVCLSIDLITSDAEKVKPFEISLQKRQENQGRSELVSSAGMFDAPAIHFQNPKQTDFCGYQVYLPNQVEDFLTFMYGDWQNPKPATNFLEYDNRNQQKQADPRSYQVSHRQIF